MIPRPSRYNGSLLQTQWCVDQFPALETPLSERSPNPRQVEVALLGACDACDALDEWKYETSLRRDKTRLNRSRSRAILLGPRRYRPYPRNQWVGALHDETRGRVYSPTREVLRMIVSGE